MKKILNLFASLLLISAPAGTLMACDSPNPTPAPNKKNFSDINIANAILKTMVNKTTITINDVKTSKINYSDLKTQLENQEPKTNLKIGDFIVANYYLTLVHLEIIGEKHNSFIGGDVVQINIIYNGTAADKTLNITVTDVNNDKASKIATELCKNAKQFNFQTTDHQKEVVDNLQKEFANKFPNQIYTVNQTTFSDVQVAGTPKDGYLKFKIKNINTNKILDNNKIFIYTFNTEIEKSFQQLDEDFKTPKLSFSLQDISLSNILPTSFASAHFAKSKEVEKLLDSFTLGDLVNNFLNPNGKYAKLMPNVMPILNDKGIADEASGLNKEFWIFINTLTADLTKNYNLDASNGDLASQTPWKLQEINEKILIVTPEVNINLYKVIENIIPDLIHFHNYLYNHQEISNSGNYLLAFFKYLEDVKQDYSIKSTGEKDGFSTVNNNGIKYLNTNFDNLIYDLLDPFQINNYNSQVVGVHIVGTSWAKNFELTYESIAVDESPTKSMLEPILNNILANKNGQDVNEPIAIQFNVGLSILWFNFKFGFNQNLSLSDLHIMELKTLIAKQFKLKGFENDVYQIDSGKVFLQGKIGTDWVDLHTLKNALNCDDIRFQFRAMNFEIKDSKDPNVYLQEKNITMNLTL